MSLVKQGAYEIVQAPAREAALDLVVPFTTPELTRASLRAADRLGAGLNSVVRLLRFQIVPFPLKLEESPVLLNFMKEQLQQLDSELPLHSEIVLTRDFDAALKNTLGPGSVVVLATRKRPWRTRTERLAARLTRDGRKVILVRQGDHDA